MNYIYELKMKLDSSVISKSSSSSRNKLSQLLTLSSFLGLISVTFVRVSSIGLQIVATVFILVIFSGFLNNAEVLHPLLFNFGFSETADFLVLCLALYITRVARFALNFISL